MIRKDDLVDAPERRSVSSEFEIRSTGGDTLTFTGYASVFNRGYDISGGPTSGGWTETVDPGAFKRTLSENPLVHLLVNHEGLPLASTKSGTLRLASDSQGLLSEAKLDRRDPEVRSLEVKMERGDVDEMSFAFRVKRNTWSENDTLRSLDEVSLHKGDVSIVSFGANPHTSATLRSVIKMLANGEVEEEQLAELRAMSDQVDRAMALLDSTRAERQVVYVGRKATPVEQVTELVTRALANLDGSGLEDGNEDGEGVDSLAAAVHDLVADAVGCNGMGDDDSPDAADDEFDSQRNHTIASATRVSARPGNLSLDDCMRMCRPEDSPNPLTIDEAVQLAS